jgi:hypothetical protein
MYAYFVPKIEDLPKSRHTKTYKHENFLNNQTNVHVNLDQPEKLNV